MEVVEKILYLMQIGGISGTKLTSTLGLSSSSITEWKKGKAKPSVEAIVKIARFFKVTTDYLLYDEVDLPLGLPTRFTEDEIHVINRCRELQSQGLSIDDINACLSLSPDVIKLACRWETLDDDGRAVVLGVLVQEERNVPTRIAKDTT